jgi:hypothetical protein
MIATNDDFSKHGTSLRPSLTRCYPCLTMPTAKQQPLPRTPRSGWPWPDSLDALTAAPDHHTLLFENDHVRVLRTRILPGQIVPVHTHRWPAVLSLSSWSDFVRRDPQGNVLLDTRTTSEAPKLNTPIWLEPLPPHSVENVGDAEINNVHVEIKGVP